MSEPTWQYANPEKTVVWRELSDGRQESCSIEATEFLAWIAEGNAPNPYVPPPEPAPLTPAEKLAAAGLSVDELKSLLGIS
jgi:hypothetical protein